MWYRILILVLSNLYSLSAHSQSASDKDLWTKANYAATTGDFNQAITLYKSIKNYDNAPQVLYNIGTAYLKKGDIGHSILYLEKAKKLDLGNADIKQNILAANAKITDPIRNQELKLFTALRHAAYAMSLNAWAYSLLIIIICLLVVVYYSSIARLIRKSILIVLIFLTISTTILLLSRLLYYDKENVAVAVIGEQPYYDDATLTNPLPRSIPEGTIVRIISITDNAYKVQLPNGVICFVKKHNFESI